jgi:hypothetical protein
MYLCAAELQYDSDHRLRTAATEAVHRIGQVEVARAAAA